jgi:6-phosphogluconolactonase (cycloisomerase 2 family)
MRLAARSGLWCFLVISSALVAACGDDDSASGEAGDAGAGGNAGTNSAGKAGASVAGSAAGGTASGGRAGSPASAGSAGGGGADAQGGTGDQPSGGAAGSVGAAGADGDAGHAGAAGSDGGAGGAADEAEPGFAYVSTILGGLVALSRDERGSLATLEGSPVGNGHLSNVVVDHRQRFLYTLDADAAKLAMYPLAADGKLPKDPSSTTPVAAQPFTAALDPSDQFLYVTSQQDGVLSTFAVGADDGKLTPVGDPLDLGAPPAVVVVSPNGRNLYVSQQFPGGIRAFSIDAQDGSLLELDDSPFAEGEVFGGALAFTPDGAFLYNTGFALNGFAVGDGGALQLLTDEPFTEDVGSDPYASNLALDPQGRFLYVTQFLLTRHVSGFAIDADSGLLTSIGAPVTARSPYSVAVDPSGRFVYASNDDDTINGYLLRRSNGALEELPGSPFPFGGLQPEMVFFRP